MGWMRADYDSFRSQPHNRQGIRAGSSERPLPCLSQLPLELALAQGASLQLGVPESCSSIALRRDLRCHAMSNHSAQFNGQADPNP